MIKTPVQYDAVNQRVIDSGGDDLFTTEGIYDHEANEIVESINMHDKAISILNMIKCIDGMDMGSAIDFILSIKTEINDLLEFANDQYRS